MEEKKEPLKINLKAAILWVIIIILLIFIIGLGIYNKFYKEQESNNADIKNVESENLINEKEEDENEENVENTSQEDIVNNNTVGTNQVEENDDAKNFIQLNSKFYSIEDIATKKVNVYELEENGEIKVDLDNDGVSEVIKKTKEDDEDPLSTNDSLSMNGEIFNYEIYVDTMLYVVDINKNDKYSNVVVYSAGESDNSASYSIYKYNGENLEFVEILYGLDMFVDETGKMIVDSSVASVLLPKIATSYYEYKNDQITNTELNIDKISNTKFNIDDELSQMVYFTESLNNVEKVLQNMSEGEVSSLEDNGIYDINNQSKYNFSNLQISEFLTGEYSGDIKVKLSDGTVGYLIGNHFSG